MPVSVQRAGFMPILNWALNNPNIAPLAWLAPARLRDIDRSSIFGVRTKHRKIFHFNDYFDWLVTSTSSKCLLLLYIVNVVLIMCRRLRYWHKFDAFTWHPIFQLALLGQVSKKEEVFFLGKSSFLKLFKNSK